MKLILEILIGLGTFTVITGLIQPWWVLWWNSKQNRVLVLKYYGIPLCVLLLLHFVLVNL